MVQLGRTISPRPADRWMYVRELQRRKGSQLPGIVTVAAIDLDDRIHIGTSGLKRLGRRLANVARHALFEDSRVTSGPRVASVTLADAVLYNRLIENSAVRATFEGVNGRLRPDCHIAGFSLRNEQGEPIAEFFDVMVDPADHTSVLCLVGQPIPPGAKLWYGYGLNPYCNLADDEDMGVRAFGPMAILTVPDDSGATRQELNSNVIGCIRTTTRGAIP